MSSNAGQGPFVSASNFLALTQLLDVWRGTLNALNLSDLANVNLVISTTFPDQIVFQQGVAVVNDNNWQFVALAEPSTVTDYDPSSLAIPPTPDYPFITTFVGGQVELEFANVDYGDVDTVEHTRISRRTIGEELIVFKDPTWPTTETLKFKLIDITMTQGKAMLDFIQTYLAQQIKLQDWYGVRWLGVIVNPEASLIQTGAMSNVQADMSLRLNFKVFKLAMK